ncbi:MAG: hypothetical protein R3E31_04415 [Chloroflexota bacterium]
MVSKTAAAWLFLLLLVARRWRVVGWAVAAAIPSSSSHSSGMAYHPGSLIFPCYQKE